MNYNQINRNSLMSSIYSDRPSYPYNPPTETSKNTAQEQHLNPSKSKLNVRQSLNKTTENYNSVNPTIVNIRNSCLLPGSISTHNPSKQDNFLEDKYFKTFKENKEPTYTPIGRENYCRHSLVGPSLLGGEQRRKSQSVRFRSGSINDFPFKLDGQFRPYDLDQPKKEERADRGQKTQSTEQLRGLIEALSKRVANNEQEIGKLRDKNVKEKRIEAIQSQLGQYKTKMYQLAKFNSKNYIDLESKLQQSQQSLLQLREKAMRPQVEGSRKIDLLESKLNQLYGQFADREQNIDKQVKSQLFNTEKQLKRFVNEELVLLKTGIQLAKKQAAETDNQLKRLEIELADTIPVNTSQLRSSNNKCIDSLVLEAKQVLTLRQDPIKDRTKQFVNYPQSSRRQFIDEKRDYLDTPRRESKNQQGKRELIIKQKLYYIDTNGYLLDQNKYYLLNTKNQQILLPHHLILSLKENNMLAGLTFRR